MHNKYQYNSKEVIYYVFYSIGGDLSNYVTTSDLTAALDDYASLDNSGGFPDANSVTKELVYINGFQSNLTNYPSEVSNTIGIMLTRLFYYSGDLTVPRMQLVFTLIGKSFCRFFDGTSWTPWLSNGVGNLNALTTTDKSSCVGAINEVNSLLDIPTLLASCTDKDTPTDVSNIDISEYKLLVLSLGANNANYGHTTIPTSLIPTYAKRIKVNVFTSTGALDATTTCSFASGQFNITNNSYPAYLYGIK